MSDTQCATLDRVVFYYYDDLEEDHISQYFYPSNSWSIGTNEMIHHLVEHKSMITVVNVFDQSYHY